MSDEERRSAVMQLRELRTSPQSLGRAMRQSAAQKVEESEDEEEMTVDGLSLSVGSAKPRKKKSAATAVSTKDLYKELGL